MKNNCVEKFNNWLTMTILVATICGAAFAGTSKILALILKDQFDSIYNRISCVETNQKVLNVQLDSLNNTVNKIWYRVK